MDIIITFIIIIGSPVAIVVLLQLYCKIEAKIRDRAKRKYRKLAEQGNSAGQFMFGMYYCDNMVETVEWLRKAVEQEHGKAYVALARCYGEGKGVEKDKVEMIKLLREAAEHCVVEAQLELALCYRQGYGVEIDYVEMVKWYREAAEWGNADGQYHLGECYYWGKGVPRDKTQARKWWNNAKKQGDTRGGFTWRTDGMYESF